MALLPCALMAQQPPGELPAAASTQLARSLEASAPHARHVWRDTAPVNPDGSVNGYVEIPRGERRKFEFDIGRNRLAIDRIMPQEIGGYPVNYGFVPQTISYDGDPFDVLVLGPSLPRGRLVRGVIVGLMQMEDEKGLDSKVVISPIGRDGGALFELPAPVRDRIAAFFRKYKQHEPGKFSRVPGWGTVAEGRAFVETTNAFFLQCRDRAGAACRL